MQFYFHCRRSLYCVFFLGCNESPIGTSLCYGVHLWFINIAVPQHHTWYSQLCSAVFGFDCIQSYFEQIQGCGERAEAVRVASVLQACTCCLVMLCGHVWNVEKEASCFWRSACSSSCQTLISSVSSVLAWRSGPLSNRFIKQRTERSL